MSSEASSIKSVTLLTIIAETVLKDAIIKLLKNHEVSGYTINQVQGEGSHGRRLGDVAGYNTNIEIKTLVSLEVSDAILESIKDYQGNHALLAFRQNVEALA
jgi:nitrogen regulatory protein PII